MESSLFGPSAKSILHLDPGTESGVHNLYDVPRLAMMQASALPQALASCHCQKRSCDSLRSLDWYPLREEH